MILKSSHNIKESNKKGCFIMDMSSAVFASSQIST